jgi:hypothetical protein
VEALPKKPELDVVIRRVYEIYVARARVLLPIAAVVTLPFLPVGLIDIGPTPDEAKFPELWFAVGSLFFGFALSFVYEGLVAEAVRRHRAGGDVAIGPLLRVVAPRFPTLILAGTAFSVAVGTGILLLVVPGLVLMTRLALIFPIVVIEGVSVRQALRRSNALVKGNSWRVFFALVIVMVVSTAIGSLLGPILSAFGSGDAARVISSYVGGVVVAPAGGIVATVIYFELADAPQSTQAT